MKNQTINYLAFGILSLLWIIFIIALAWNPSYLDSAWQTFRSWPLLLQALVGLLFLPIALGLWIWQSSWVIWLRLVLVLGLALVTIYMFFPRKAHEPQPKQSPDHT